MIYDIKYVTEVEKQILAMDDKRQRAFFEGMSHLVTDPFPEQCVRRGQTAELNVTQFLRITYVVSDRIIAVIAVVRMEDTKPLFREPE